MKINFNSRLTFLLITLISIQDCQSSNIKGPPTAEKKDLRKIVRKGDDVRLHCPMSGHPTLMMEWSKGQESIKEYIWTRFRMYKKSLKINKVTLRDSGIYYCKGTNGFGSETVKIHLIVLDPNDFPDLENGEIPNVSPPEWTLQTREGLQSHYRLSAGDDLRLVCEATAEPEPTIVWYNERNDVLSRNGELLIEDASVSSAGLYSCMASNAIGRAVRNVSVDVGGKTDDRLAKFGGRNRPETVSAEEGQTAVLKCEIRSRKEPKIKWLKRLEPWEYSRYADVIEVENQKFRFIVNPESLNVVEDNGEYVNELIIPGVSAADTGMYYCFVASSVDYKFKATLLNVIPKTESYGKNQIERDPVLIVVICLAIFVFFLLIAITFCVVTKRRNKDVSSTTVESTDVQENLMQNGNRLKGAGMMNKLDQPLPVPPTTLIGGNPYSGSRYYAGETSSNKIYNDPSFYQPPPPPSIASQNQYEVPHVPQRRGERYLYGGGSYVGGSDGSQLMYGSRPAYPHYQD